MITQRNILQIVIKNSLGRNKPKPWIKGVTLNIILYQGKTDALT